MSEGYDASIYSARIFPTDIPNYVFQFKKKTVSMNEIKETSTLGEHVNFNRAKQLTKIYRG